MRIDQIRAALLRDGGGADMPQSADALALRTGADAARAPTWCIDQIAGRLVELSAAGAAATLTAAVGLLIEVQQRGEPAAWVTGADSAFYPPDLADSGVDLAALVIVRVPAAEAAVRAADRLLRSGGFGLVVVDLGRSGELPAVAQGRLAGLAQKHDAAVVCVTEKAGDAGSLGSVVSLRAEALRGAAPDGGRFECRLRALKDKRRGPGWRHVEAVRGPDGMR